MEGGRQLKLLLWRDYLIRKRNFITLAGILWASGIMFGIYTVRLNVDNQAFPTCQFPARALPSAGMIPFLQSFICSVNNECSPMDQYEEIPAYSNSTLTKIQRKIAPVINETVIELATSMPDAVKLLATVAKVADEPTFMDFAKNGLKLSDLFKNPSRVKRYVTSRLQLDDDVAQSLMTSHISFQGILNGDMDKCRPASISKTIQIQNKEHLNMFVKKLCNTSKEELQKMMLDLIYEVNLSKYIKMVGNMYEKMSGDDRLTKLGDFVTAVMRMTKINNFLPPELFEIFQGKKQDFSYLKINLIQKFVKLFEPTFGDTEEYKSVNDLADTLVVGVQYLNRIFGNLSNNDTVDDITDVTVANIGNGLDIKGFDKMSKVLNNAAEVVEQIGDSDKKSAIDPFEVLTQITNLIHKFLPNNSKHDVLFYSTILAKLLESANKVIYINMNIEDIIYNVTSKHSEAVKVMVGLPPSIVGKGLEALVSPERTQLVTSKLSAPGHVFCDIGKLRAFFDIAKEEAENVKKQLCTDVWKNYVGDLVQVFGVHDVKNHINEMASLFIQETLGKDTSSQLYPIDQDFRILKNFTSDLLTMEAERRPRRDWNEVLGVGSDSSFMKVVMEKAHLGKLILISVHGALAKEVVNQNVILQYKITPILLDTATMLEALNNQLGLIPEHVTEGLKNMYTDVVRTVLLTAMDEVKTYKSLSTFSEDVLCHGGENMENYLQTSDVNRDKLALVLCNAFEAIEDGLKTDSIISKAVTKIRNKEHSLLEQINWINLVSIIQKLYVKIDRDYPYVFEYSTYAMDKVTQDEIQKMLEEAKEYWFSLKNLQRSLHLSVNLGFRLLDIMDHDLFDMSSETWLKLKFFTNSLIGPLNIIDDVIRTVAGSLTNSTDISDLPPITAKALGRIAPNMPNLIVDAVNILISDNTDIEPVITLMNAQPPWPCSSSLSELLTLSPSSVEAVQGMETLLCLDVDLVDEWREYLDVKRARFNKTQRWNNTVFEPHIFLKMSATFDALVNDTAIIKDALNYIINDEYSDDHIGLVSAWKYAVDTMNTTDRGEVIGKFLSKFDTVLNSIETPLPNGNVTLNNLWEQYIRCFREEFVGTCRGTGRAAWKYALIMFAAVVDDVADDLNTYFTEINEPDANPLQVLGFTRGTALYMLYDRLPQFVSVLLNSYWDFGFMAQIRRASLTSFWDCDALVSALTPPPDSPIRKEDISRVTPYLCPSIIYWLSMPRGDNVLFNLVAKPQYYVYSLAVENTTSYFEQTYAKASSLGNLIADLTKEKKSLTKELEINNMKNKLAKFVDKILNYKINDTAPSYKEFANIYRNKFISDIYLARIVTLTNKITNAFVNLTIDENISDNKSEIDKIKADLSSINIIYRRKSVDVIAIHFDLLTDVLWRNDSNYTLIDALENMCSNIKENRIILATEPRVKLQICAKNYKVLYKSIGNVTNDGNEEIRQSLLNLVKILENEDLDETADIFEFLNNRTELVESLKHSIKASYDLGLPHYLQYIQTNLHTYRVLITFISGGDWWKDLSDVFNGPYARDFFEYFENSFEIVDNVLNNLDGIHLVRLIRDINLNETDSFCRPNITLSDYVPDSTGLLSRMKQQICTTETVDVFREIPPLLYASQGYENSLKLPKDIDYSALKRDISDTESRVLHLQDPKEPSRPTWVTDEKIDLMRRDMMQLLNKESIAKVVFGVLGNGVDAGTLFLNNTDCTLCSQLTSWFKQLNLQVFKKQEYDNLLCHLHTMTLQEVYHTLKNDFHWDMFIKELISSRNYTKYELNKSMNEFLELVKVHFLDDLTAPTTKLTECLANNVTRNEFGNATLVFSVLARTTKLLQAETPYLQDIEGIKDIPYLKQLESEVAHKLDVFRPIKDYLNKDNKLHFEGIDEAVINLRVALMKTPSLEDLIPNIDWNKGNFTDVLDKILNNLDTKKIEEEGPRLQKLEYWRFPFMSSILSHVEGVLSHTARLAGVASTLDVRAAVDGRIDALLDVVVVILTDDSVDAVAYSVYGLINELHPLLKGTALEDDLDALAAGLKIIHQFKTYLVEEVDLKLPISSYFHGDGVELGLTGLGINNTNFWSLAAPRIQDGYINLKPVISPKSLPYHISTFACDMDTMSTAVLPASLDVVTLEDVLAATLEQFCGLDQSVVVDVLGVLVRNIRLEGIVEKLKSFLLTKLYSASSLTPSEGEMVLQRFPRMATLLPSLQGHLAEVLDLVMEEPLIEKLKDFTTVGNLLASDFLGDAGRMMCGKPFRTDMNRIIQNIIKSKDQKPEVDHRQLESLPSDFCRSMYQEIINMDGGKIVWSFIKPLLMGRILFAPDTPAVYTLMNKVNGTFSSMIRLSNLVHSFASAFPSLDTLSTHRGGLQALQQLVNQPGMEDVRRGVIGDVEVNVDVDGALGKLDDFKDMGGLVSKASSLLHCIRLDRLSPVRNETALMLQAGQLMLVNEFSAGIVFLNPEELEHSLTNVQYKIRMDIENAPTTNRMTSYFWTPGPEASFVENMRYFRGFIQVQDMVDKAIIQLAMEESRTKDLARRTKRDTSLRIEDSRFKEVVPVRRTKRDMSLRIDGPRIENSSVEDLDWAVYTQQMPYPCYTKDYFQNSLYESQALIVGFFFSLLFTVVSVVRFIVADKESGNTMLMSVMGVNLSYHTMSWFVASFIEVTATTTAIAVILKFAHILPRTDFSLIFVLLFLFGISVLSFCYMISKVSTSASLSGVCAGIVYLISFMPIVLILTLEALMENSFKLLVCLFMSSSFSYSFVYITRYEAIGTGAHWAQLWDSPTNDGMSIGYSALMIVFDAALYFFIGLCIDRYFGIKSISHSTITRTSTTNEKAGVSIVSVSKVYGEGSRKAKVALDNVSMELQRGQITTLLGHNGAGKTTLIKILTGMLKPSKGHVVIRDGPGCDGGGGGRAARAGRAGVGVGVCPQHDVLVECLTTREHVTLYAKLEAGKDEDVEDMVDKMLKSMSLSAYGDVRASRLSGGTRRRLCVALAFVARAHLVVLDEPTAGVDPTNRRDIWSMVMKLKAGRTILLTTHHLDEAEILSDQIVIMHKGQIHTTGSPVEIKRSLGSGYKLTVTLSSHADADGDADTDGGERCKRILGAVRQVVRNAAVFDITDTQVEIMLPFYDADGANNNFLALCTSLEEKQAILGYDTFVLDCSSLEQVFHDICSKADGKDTVEYAAEEQGASSSGSSSSLRSSQRALVGAGGARRGQRWAQFKALMWARALSLMRNKSLAFMVLVLPTIFVTVAMAFSTIRPPADNEIALPLTETLYDNTTQFLMPYPSMQSNYIDPSFAIQVMNQLQMNKDVRNWTQKDTPRCKCLPTRQECTVENVTRPEMMLLPDVNTLNDWLVDSQQAYILKRYGGYTSAIVNNRTHYLAWYNNKGHHAMPTYVSSLNNAILRSLAGDEYNITTYSHPMKISKEQLSKDTVYQHIADAGVSALVLIALALCGAGGAAPLVSARARREDRLQRLAAVAPPLYWAAALASDMLVILINMLLTAIVMAAFGFPVFVWRNNLPAICLLIMLYGFACCSLVHVLQKLFSDASLANMILFCGNAFCGLIGITILLILDVISESDRTDNARWVLHKCFLLSPQFALGDGLLEIAKNTVQAEVLVRFGMDTYKDPFSSDLLTLHYSYLVVVGIFLVLLNLAIEGGYFYWLVDWFSPSLPPIKKNPLEPEEISAERRRVAAARSIPYDTLSLPTLGNINKGFVDTEGKKNSLQRTVVSSRDVLSCEGLTKVYGGACAGAPDLALVDLTLGVQPGQCLALLGENGAGKSTTFSMWAGETRPSAGTVALHGLDRDQRGLCRGLISYCPQSDAVDPLLTVRETLQLYCRLRGITEEDEVVQRTMEMFNLSKYSSVRSGALSGGNRRKLCAALAVAARAPLLLLDEPTSGMDPVSRGCVWRGVGSARSAGRAVVLSTHALEDARRAATRVALLRRGQLAALASLQDCLDRFGGGYVVSCRCASPSGAWRRVSRVSPLARLRVLHCNTLHFHIPTRAIVEKKEVVTHLSDIFRMMSELQATTDIEDYTVNQSSLEQMFLNFSDKSELNVSEEPEPEPEPEVEPEPLRWNSEQLDSVTSL